MKRKILTILIGGMMLIALTGCNNKNEFEVGEQSDIKIVKNDIFLSIKEDTLKNTGVTLILKNNSNDKVQYGEPYEIEIKQNGVWHKIDVQIDFIMPIYDLDAKESTEIEIDWANEYGKLAKGEYRIIKSINVEKEETIESFNVATEFVIK